MVHKSTYFDPDFEPSHPCDEFGNSVRLFFILRLDIVNTQHTRISFHRKHEKLYLKVYLKVYSIRVYSYFSHGKMYTFCIPYTFFGKMYFTRWYTKMYTTKAASTPGLFFKQKSVCKQWTHDTSVFSCPIVLEREECCCIF